MNKRKISSTNKEDDDMRLHKNHHRPLHKENQDVSSPIEIFAEIPIISAVGENNDLLGRVLLYLDVMALSNNKRVCKRWE